MPANLTFIACLALFLSCAAGAAEDDTPPNIIIILADDQGYADLGVQGAKDIPTPNLDALARDGVRCTRGYVSAPVCSPSRAGLLTGRYQNRFGHDNNARDNSDGLPLTEILLPKLLSAGGYSTACIGKWHLGYRDAYSPLNRGFTRHFGFIGGGHKYFENDPAIIAKDDKSSYLAQILDDGSPVLVKEYLTDAFAAKACDYLSAEITAKKPFFLYLAFNAPHSPVEAPAERIAAMPEPIVKDARRRGYAAMVSKVDDAVGRIRAILKETGADKNTLLAYLSDNGAATNNGSDNGPLRDRKGSLYEGGIRVPFLAVWPGVIPAGTTTDVPVTARDLFATACALAKVPLPADRTMDSRNIMPVLTGKSNKPVHDTLFWRFPSFGRAALEGSLKLVARKKGPVELYDLTKDPTESKDLAAARPADAKRLHAALDRWENDMVTPLWGPGSAKPAAFFAPGPKAPADLPANRIFPRGRTMLIAGYSGKPERDLKQGFTVGGPFYGTQREVDPLLEAGLPTFVQIGLPGHVSTGTATFDLTETRAVVTAQLDRWAGNPNVTCWSVQPEELRSWRKDEMAYLDLVTDLIRERDHLERPVFLYQCNNRDSSVLKGVASHLDILGKGSYVNSSNYTNDRGWVRWSIEQSDKASRLAGRKPYSLVMPELCADPEPGLERMIPIWVRHDTYLGLMAGAKGVLIWSLHPRKEVRKTWQKWYDAYSTVARELSSGENLGEVFLFGENRSDLTVTPVEDRPVYNLNEIENKEDAQDKSARKKVPPMMVHPWTTRELAYGKSRYLFVANSFSKPTTFRVKGIPKSGVSAVRVFDGKPQPLPGSSKSLALRLAPWEVVALRFDTAN